MLDGEQPFDAAAQFDPLRYGQWASCPSGAGSVHDKPASGEVPTRE